MINHSQIANLTIKQAAERMNVSVSTVKRRIKAGMPCVKEPGGWVRLSLKDIIDFQQQHRHVQEEEQEIMTPKKAVAIVESVR